MPRTLLRAVLVLVSSLLGLLIAEGGLRIRFPQATAVPWQDEISGIASLQPNARGRHVVPHTFNVTVSVNSQRFRGRREYAPEPPLGVIRIAVLGDSFTFGLGANDDESYPAQLERILADAVRKGRVEVINAGVPGTGTGEEALYYDIWVKRFHPQVVVLTVYRNDVENDRRQRVFNLDERGRASSRTMQELRATSQRRRLLWQVANAVPGYPFLAQHSHLLNLLRRTISAIAVRKKAVIDWEYLRKEGLALMGAEVTWLKQRTQESGARLVVVFLPRRHTIQPSRRPPEEWNRRNPHAMINALKEVCSREGIPFIDITPLIRVWAEKLHHSLYYTGRRDYHATPEGYRLFAEAISSFLLKEGVI